MCYYNIIVIYYYYYNYYLTAPYISNLCNCNKEWLCIGLKKSFKGLFKNVISMTNRKVLDRVTFRLFINIVLAFIKKRSLLNPLFCQLLQEISDFSTGNEEVRCCVVVVLWARYSDWFKAFHRRTYTKVS